MTLRVDVSIVPFGQEEDQYGIYRLDISNLGEVKDGGFGNVFCRYIIKIYKINNKTMQRLCKVPEFEHLFDREIPEHNRKDGAIALVKTACDLIKENT